MQDSFEDRALADAARKAADTADVQAAQRLSAMVADACVRLLRAEETRLGAGTCADSNPALQNRVQTRAF
ncbi:hypothetical protein [Futiania mangrovi]|uniref:Uncharacterized protein n=1 Tax=Futiania mangrovi TaxID=2959716 RepID=A0A9J6PHX5_9PROT|nr:hypothetical protein [Futiania mangrovii]MCP1337416.1 hypothetical protein [Futiania mangrovii]